MPVGRIERIVGGTVVGRAERNPKGLYQCHPKGSNTELVEFMTLDEVADYLRREPQGGVRMNPGWGKIVRNIFIDGTPR